MKRITGKRIDIILIVVALIILGIVIVNRLPKEVNGHERIDITISSRSELLFGKDVVHTLIREFEDYYPDLRVLVSPEEDSDIIFFDDSALSDFINNSVLISLAPYNDAESHVEQSAAHWALPLVSFMDLFFYNVDVLMAANRDRPPRTRAEFIATARAVAESNAALSRTETVFPFALGLSQHDPVALRRELYPWIWADGGEIYLPDAENGTVALSREALNTISFLSQLDRDGLLAPHTFEKNGAQRLAEFARGNIAMMTAPAQSIAILRRSTPGVNFGITTIPVTAHRKNRLGLSGIYAGISSNCLLPDEAWTFLAFIEGKAQVLAEVLGAVPGSFSSIFPDEYITQDPLYSKARDIFEAADIVEYLPDQFSEKEIERLIREQLVKAMGN